MAGKRYASDPKTRAAELRAEGRFGGRQPGAGRPRKSASDSQQKRAATVVAEAARDNAHLIAKVFVDVLEDDSTTDTQKIRAVKTMLGVESGEEDRQRDERRESRRPEPPQIETREDAIAVLAEALSDPIVRERFLARLPAG